MISLPGQGRGLVITPTYNERENISRIVPATLQRDSRLDVLIIDDASPDGTGELADAIAESDSRVHVIHRPAKLGLGTAYLAGFRWGLERGYEWIFEMDADFSHDPAHLPQFMEALIGLVAQVDQASEQGNPEAKALSEKLSKVYKTALKYSMQRNLGEQKIQ